MACYRVNFAFTSNFTLMTKTEMVFETSVYSLFSHYTRLLTPEYSINR